ncbi:hypothetical protein Hanom_Chr14g01263881 [Helianthus anomalus]
MENTCFYHWSDINDVKRQFSRWYMEENSADEELNRKIDIISDNNYKKTWSSIGLLDEVLHSPTSDFKNNAEEFITQMLKQDQKIYDMLVVIQNKRKNEIAGKKARVYKILASVNCRV